jgi:general secretion pathway protein H
LLELLVALAIVAMVLAAVPLMAGGSRPGAEARAAAIELASALRRTRGASIVGFHSETFVLDTERGVYRAGPAKTEAALPEGLELSLYTARSELVDENMGRIRFFPDGSATGGRITLTSGAHSYVVAVDWLTGAVEVGQ